MRHVSRFYTRDDFDVVFSRWVPKGQAHHYLKGQLVSRRKIGEAISDEGWDEIRFNPADRWVCPETPQQRRRKAKGRAR